MQRTRWTQGQKAEALRIFREAGAAEASKRTGVPIATISSWARRAGETATGEERVASVIAKDLTLAQRRQALGEKFLSKAESLIDRVSMGDEAIDRKRGIEAARIAAEAAQLLTGQPTSRVDATLGTDQERALAIVRSLDERRQATG